MMSQTHPTTPMTRLLGEHVCFYRNGLSRSGNEYGPVTDLPDWTFVGTDTVELAILSVIMIMYERSDGRPPVQGKGQQRREVKQVAFSVRTQI